MVQYGEEAVGRRAMALAGHVPPVVYHHARAHARDKRGGGALHVPLDTGFEFGL